MVRLLAVSGSLLAALSLGSPAMAGCPLGWTGKFCYSVDVNSGGTHILNYGDTPQSAGTPYSDLAGQAVASSDSAHNGTLSVSATVNSYGYTSSAYADIQYSFRATSKPGTIPDGTKIPVHVKASATSLRDSDHGVSEYAVFDLEQDFHRLIYQSAGQPAGRLMNIFSIDQWIYVKPDDDITLFMSAWATANASLEYSKQTDRIVVDPVFEIAPDFASLYTLVGLPEGVVSPPTPAPEPASWAMMVGGFGLIGSAMRGRRRVTAAASAC